MRSRSRLHYRLSLLLRWLNVFQKLSLRRVLVIPFVLQVAIAVGLTGWLSIRNGQQAVNDVTAQLREEVTARIQQQVQEAIATPQTLMAMNESLVAMGVVDLSDRTFMEQYLIRQLQAFPGLGELSFTTAQGKYLSVERREDKLNLLVSDHANSEDLHRYQLRDDGSVATLLEISPNFNPQYQPNYVAALKGRDRTWGEIYTNTDSEFLELQSLSLPMVQPVYDAQDQVVGVWEAELRLTQIGDFLRSLEIGKSGQAFIIERSGLLVASSTLEQPFLITYGSTLRIKAQNSIDPLIQAAATYLQDNVNLQTLDRLEPLEFKLQGERQFLQITPISDPYGLDWLIVVVVPEQDFMGRIQANTRLTIALCLVALSISVLIGWLTARWLTQPLWNLIQATRAIALGDWDQTVKHGSILEIRQLAETFNQMAQQLKSSFAALAQANEQLEARVQRRTAALTAAESELRGLFEAMSELVFVKDSEGRYLKIPSSQPQLSLIYGDLASLIGKTDAELLPPDCAAKFLDYIHQVLTHQQMLTVEYALPLQQGNPETLIWFGANISPIGSDQVLWVARDITARKQAEELLHIEQNRVEALLRNILPDAIAERLKSNTELVADYFEQVTILFVDIVGFSRIASELAPNELVTWLNQLFSCFDQLADWHELEKIKTIGDAYMVVGGLPVHREDHAMAIADFALDIQNAMSNFRTPAGEPIHIRIGIHSGPVVAGVIGLSKFSYDLWGKAVNIASRMESHGQADHIQVSQSTYELLKSDFLLTERGRVEIRGFGAMPTYWLMSRQ